MVEISRLDEVKNQLNYYTNTNKEQRTLEVLENIAITNALIYDKLNEISKKLDNKE